MQKSEKMHSVTLIHERNMDRQQTRRYLNMHGMFKSKLQLTVAYLFMIVNLVSAQANITISDAISSGKTYFRPTTQGPEFEHFSVCTSTTTCFITKRAETVWTSTTLNQVFPQSSLPRGLTT